MNRTEILIQNQLVKIEGRPDGTTQFSLPDRNVILPKKATVSLQKDAAEKTGGEKRLIQDPPAQFATSEPIHLRAGVIFENHVNYKDPRFMGIEALINAFGKPIPPELPQLIEAVQEMGWEIEAEVFEVLAQARLGLGR